MIKEWVILLIRVSLIIKFGMTVQNDELHEISTCFLFLNQRSFPLKQEPSLRRVKRFPAHRLSTNSHLINSKKILFKFLHTKTLEEWAIYVRVMTRRRVTQKALKYT